MFVFCRLLLLLTVALLPLVSCQDSDLDCECTNLSDRSVTVELDCAGSLDGGLEGSCNKADVPVIPDGYSLVDGYGLYKLYRHAVKWDEAKTFCELEGGRLAVPLDETQFAALEGLISARPGLTIAWTGINDIDEEGVYVDTEGNAAAYLPWRPDQPDHHLDILGRKEYCVEIRPDGVNDIHCTDQVPFICEIPLARDDYTWVAGASRFVKVHTDALSYDEAQATCESEGATLAVVETWDRAGAVLDLLSEDTGYSWVDFTDAEEEGNFVTSTGRKLTNMEFVNWRKAQPSGADAENCLSLSYKGWYDDKDCSTALSFICQITST